MEKKITLALENAEKNYTDFKHLETSNTVLPSHIMALSALFESFIHYGLAVSQVPEAIKNLEEETEIFEILIQPHLHVVNDVDMISKEYVKMFVQYIAQISIGEESKIAVKKLFA